MTAAKGITNSVQELKQDWLDFMGFIPASEFSDYETEDEALSAELENGFGTPRDWIQAGCNTCTYRSAGVNIGCFDPASAKQLEQDFEGDTDWLSQKTDDGLTLGYAFANGDISLDELKAYLS